MDPSYGGCAFLRVGLDELSSLGAGSPQESVYGTDIDGESARWASHLIAAGVPASHLLASDFLSLLPGQELPLVGALVGNPPYVRHHRLTSGATATALAAMERAGVALNGRANLWAYFVIHAAQFVKEAGRMALLLPGSALHADYAQPVLRHLADKFGEVLLVRIGERVFDDAQEETVVLLASRAGERSDNVRTQECRGLKELSAFLGAGPTTSTSSEYEADWKRSILDPAGRRLFEGLLDRSSHLVTLGSIAEVRIGTVTGANEFFITTPSEIESLQMQEHSVDVIARSVWLTGSTFALEELRSKGNAGQRTKLLSLPADLDISKYPALSDRIRAAERKGVHLRTKCQRHPHPWWSLGNIPIPDAFLPYMGAHHRGLVANASRSASTNAIHQIRWGGHLSENAKSGAILSSWSSLTALSAELYGRSYGGGVLKVEPSVAKRLLILSTPTNTAPHGKARSVREVADATMADALHLTAREQETITRNLQRLAHRRSLEVRGEQRAVTAPLAS
jgi:adenine-specific DNA methylase